MITLGPRPALPAPWLIAVRDLTHDWRRSLLVTVLIMVPMAVLIAVLIISTSMRPSLRDTVRVQFGQAAGALTALNCDQQSGLVHPYCEGIGPTSTVRAVEPATASELLAAVPAGQRGVLERFGPSVLEADGIPVQVTAIETNVADSLLDGRYELVSGAWPVADEIVINRNLADRGVEVGQWVTVSGGTYRVSGVVSAYGGFETFNALSLVMVLAVGHPAADFETDYAGVRVFLEGGVPPPEAYPSFNAQGIGIASRDQILSSGDPDRVLVDLNGSYGSIVVMGALLVLVMAILVAGSAMAVGAKRKEKLLALLAATGARPRVLRAIFGVQGLFIGVAAIVLACGLGLLAALGFLALVSVLSWGWVFGLHIPWLWLAGAVVVALLSGVLASLIPGARVARADPAKALQERHRRARPIVAGAGLVLVAIAVIVCVALVHETDRLREANLLTTTSMRPYGWGLFGCILATIAGVLLGVPLILRFVGTAPTWLPLSWRLALRDLGRAGHRTVPTTVAIVAAAMTAGAVVMGASFTVDAQRDQHYWGARQGEIVATLNPAGATATGAEEVVVALREAAELSEVRVIHEVAPLEESLVSVQVRDVPENSCPEAGADPVDWRCSSSWWSEGFGAFSGIVVADASAVEVMAGVSPTAAMQQHLDAGGAIVFGPRAVDPNGHVGFVRTEQTTCATGECPLPKETLLGSVPALQIQPHGRAAHGVLISEATAHRLDMLGGEVVLRNVVWARAATTPSATEADLIKATVDRIVPGSYTSVERGPEDLTAIPWLFSGIMAAVLLLTVGITTVLAMAERRTDEAVLGSLGASPHLRRGMAGAQAACLAAVGAILGVALGAFLTAAVIRMTYAVIPRPALELGFLMLGVPLLAWVIAWLTTSPRAGMRDDWVAVRPQALGDGG